jgi:glycosyltransferase involved in cell wall biosynthesis
VPNLPAPVVIEMSLTNHQRFQQLRVAVLVPTYNNARTLGPLLQDIQQYTDQIIIVNDGSTDDTSKILSQSGIEHVIDYETNVGKGWALRCGFKKAIELGFEYVITIDSDGQHFPEDLPKFLDTLERNPGCLIIGKRNMEQAGIPGKSSFGNKFSNFWYWVETGIKMEDTQSGYRLYPVAQLKSLHFFTKKFEFEIEVIVRAAWKGISIQSVPVKIHYEEEGKRISHFRPFQDFSRISVLNTFLVMIALFYFWPLDFIKRLFKKETRQQVIRQILHPDDSNFKKAASIGFGVFMGIVPIWGFQMITAITLSVLLKMNKALVIVAANISFPPFIPFILFLSHLTGKIWMGKNAVDLSFDKGITLDDLHNSFFQYVAGAITLSILLGLITGVVSFTLLSLFRKKRVAV